MIHIQTESYIVYELFDTGKHGERFDDITRLEVTEGGALKLYKFINGQDNLYKVFPPHAYEEVEIVEREIEPEYLGISFNTGLVVDEEVYHEL